MFAFTMHTRFPHRDLRSPGGPARRILARAAAAACVITGIWAAGASPASATVASAGPAVASQGVAGPASASPAAAGLGRPPAARAAGTSRPGPAFSHLLVVTDLADAGPGSLRAAITAADARPPGTSTLIDFNVAGTITLASRLPAIKRPMKVNGTSAPVYRTGGPPVVEIDCDSHGGLHFGAGSAGSQLLGLAVDNSSGNIGKVATPV